MVRHALNPHPPRTEKAIQRERSASEQTSAEISDVRIHRDAGILPQESSRLDVDRLARPKRFRKNIAIPVQ